MNTKEYMNEVHKLKHRIMRKRREAETIRLNEGTPSSPQFSDMPKNATPDNNRMQNNLLKAIELDREADVAFDDLENLKLRFKAVIDAICDTDDRDLLYKRYIEFKPWRQVADELGYSESHTKRLHTKAVKKVDTP